MASLRNVSRRLRMLLLLGAVFACVWLLWFRKNSLATVSYAEAVKRAAELHAEQQYGQVLQLLQNYVGELEQDAAGLYLLSDSRLQLPLPNDNEHVSQADAGFRLVLSIDPDHEGAVRRLFEIHRRGHAWSPAIKYGLKACELAPLDVDLRENLATAMYRDGKFDQALAQADVVLDQCPDRITAAELQIRCRVMLRQSAEVIDDFVMEFLSDNTDAAAGTRLRYVLLDTLGDTEAAEREVIQAVTDVPSDSSHSLWLAEELERHGQMMAALELIPESAPAKHTEGTDEFVNRLFHAGEYQRLLQYTAGHPLSEASEDVIVQRAFAQWVMGLPAEAHATSRALEGRTTRSSRLWQQVFDCLVSDDADARRLLAAAQTGSMACPGSASFCYMKAHALVAMGEADLAITEYRRSIALTPRWVSPRLAVALQLIERSDYLAALVECSEVLRINSQCAPAYDLLLLSSLKLIRADGAMPAEIHSTILNGIGLLGSATLDDQAQDLLNAISGLLNNDEDSANRFVQQRLETLTGRSVDPEALQVLALLASDADLRGQVQAMTREQLGLPLREVVQDALKIESTVEAVQWIEDDQSQGRKLDAVSTQLAVAELLSVRTDPQAESHWNAILEQHSDNLRVLKYAEQTPSLRWIPDVRANIVELMRQFQPEGLEWQLSDMRLKLDQQPQEEELAAMILQLSDLLSEAPTCQQGYALLATAYARVDRADKAADTLEAAITAGVDRSDFRIRLASYYSSIDSLKAVPHAMLAFQRADSDSQRAQALGVLASEEARQEIRQLFSKRLSVAASGAKLPDNLLSMIAMALVSLGDVEHVMASLASQCADSDEFFDLWLEVLRAGEVSHDDAARFITQAEPWASKPDRKRKLVVAWRGHGVRSGQRESFRMAVRQVESLLTDRPSVWDLMSAGDLYERLEEHSIALNVYAQLMTLSLTDRETVIALYRASRTRLQLNENLEIAVRELKAARAITDDPELVLLEVKILQGQGMLSEAAEVVRAALVKFPESEELRQAIAAL